MIIFYLSQRLIYLVLALPLSAFPKDEDILNETERLLVAETGGVKQE
jgi:hypothetical protein